VTNRIGLLTTVLTLAFVAPASAITPSQSSHIDSPTSPVYSYYGLIVRATSTTVTGTAQGVASVDIRCYPGSAAEPSTLMSSGNAVDGGGHFSATIDASNLTPEDCRLRAVPAGQTPTGGTAEAFAGPVLVPTDVEDSTISGGPNDGKRYGYEFTFPGTHGIFYGYSAGAQGISWSVLVDPTTLAPKTANLAENVLGLFDQDSGEVDATRSEIQVDGANAYTPFAATWLAGGFHPNATGLPGTTILHESFDPDTGTATFTTREPIVKCFPDTGFTNNHEHWSTSCTEYRATGVVLDRRLVSSADGHTLQVTDTWRSVDGIAHSFDALYDNRFEGDFVSGQYQPSSGFRFPGSSSFESYPYGPVDPLPAGPGTIYYKRTRTSPDSGDASPQGAFSYSVAPNEVKFIGSDQDGSLPEWTMRYERTLPAGGAVSFTFQLDQAPGFTDLLAFGNAFETSFGQATTPPAQPTTPLQQTTSTQQTTSVQEAGNVATAKLKHGRPSARWVGSRILVDTGDLGTCSAGTGNCSFDVLATIPSALAKGAANKKAKRVTIGKATITVKPGKSAKLTFKLSKRWTKLLARKKRLKLTVAITPKASAQAAKATTRTITVKAPKPKK
jgi:hypothetical protein